MRFAIFSKKLGARAYETCCSGFDAWTGEGCGCMGQPLDIGLKQHPKGAEPSEWPEDLRVRQFPEVRGG